MLWPLIRCLALRLPTAFQINASYAILFHEGCTSQFNRLMDPNCRTLRFPPEHPSRRIWALVDSNPSASSGTKHASLSEHLDWLKKASCGIFYMKSWSLLDIIQAHADLVSRAFHNAHAICSR